LDLAQPGPEIVLPVDPKKPLPSFQKVKQATAYDSPEELFYGLTRNKSHAYIRGQQQDVLREYKKISGGRDIGFELPTGTGKTTVGLLVAEWKRRTGQRAAYLALTNQLAAQVLEESDRLGISCADLRGTKKARSPVEEGRYLTGEAVGVTTYANLFNTNPIIQPSGVIIFDDAHSGEQTCADMWTVTITDPSLFNSALAALKASLTDAQFNAILYGSDPTNVQLCDVLGHPECIPSVLALMNESELGTQKFRWGLIKHNLSACLFLVGLGEIAIRPIIAPTDTHKPFAETEQRIYLSATLGGEGDLQRAYNINGNVQLLRANAPHWGRRYIFVPGLYSDDESAAAVIGSAWDAMSVRRAVLLAPSERQMLSHFSQLQAVFSIKPIQMLAQQIGDSLTPFTSQTEVMLTLAGRYDGLDLPDDSCRLLIMAESPAAVNALERHLSTQWKLGPLVKKRERTRLIQGMGRCTRNAADFSVIFWMGQSLVNAAASGLTKHMPPELQAELTWGIEQSKLIDSDADGLASMVRGLLEIEEYRKQANTAINEILKKQPETQFSEYHDVALEESRYAQALWAGNYSEAYERARGIADKITDSALTGYRAWWLYQASRAAALGKNFEAERDSLWRASSCGIYTGWLTSIYNHRGQQPLNKVQSEIEPNAEAIWNVMDQWGWAGPKFDKTLKTMQDFLSQSAATQYHQGLELLGKCCGLVPTRSTEPGAADVVWTFPSGLDVAFEAKTDKKLDGALYKKELQEAKGHIDWVKNKLGHMTPIEVVVVSPTAKLDDVAVPFAEGLFYLHPDEVLVWANAVAESLRKLRLGFVGHEYAIANIKFSSAIKDLKLDLLSIQQRVLVHKLM
jgi:hypothetical protein